MVASIQWDDREVVKALQKLQHAAGDLSPAFKEIGEVLVESTKQRFASGTGPDGEKWVDNSNVTIERKGRNKPLVDHGSLSEQIDYALIGNNILEIGSSMEYAAMQQFGGTKSEFPALWGDITARPFLGISFDDEEQILGILSDHLDGST
jgi:phage virion morphogenesis protein